ncbi:hypothetical protein KPL78_25390 [Roseomonas sp. HJA6]|uniref:META domain-containing protein n=1 Tax=Roseomonas alba TaxID=2846776 RepID=A0ABS7AFZ0_9PROT|nr:hypothetical protein [Neoroseomonas alba]MBW6401217.1 hypothetical protein [Neoroseomonas alba]
MSIRSRLATALLIAALPFSGASANPLAGTWRAAQGDQAVEITLSPDGAFARRDIDAAGSAMTVLGHWSITGTGPWLRLSIEDWAPRRACGLLGCTEIRMLPGETYRYRLTEDGVLLLEDSGGHLALRRAG